MKIKTLILTESERSELTLGFRTGTSHCFRMRCHALLLKSEGLSSVRVGEQSEMTAQSVNGWVKRFQSEGIKGLYTRPGQGRKPIMDCSDEEAVRKAIESDRQSVRSAKEEWQKTSGKEASELTFSRFLSALAQDIDV
jgi:transposase